MFNNITMITNILLCIASCQLKGYILWSGCHKNIFFYCQILKSFIIFQIYVTLSIYWYHLKVCSTLLMLSRFFYGAVFTKVIVQGKLFHRCTHLLYCSILSLGGNVNTIRMSSLTWDPSFTKNQWDIMV